MPLIDKSRHPLGPPRKTEGVKIHRAQKSGRVVSVRTVTAESKTLSADLRYVFSRNVKDVTGKK
jgi:hypothetical protein